MLMLPLALIDHFDLEDSVMLARCPILRVGVQTVIVHEGVGGLSLDL